MDRFGPAWVLNPGSCDADRRGSFAAVGSLIVLKSLLTAAAKLAARNIPELSPSSVLANKRAFAPDLLDSVLTAPKFSIVLR